jgi:hypothetical protein
LGSKVDLHLVSVPKETGSPPTVPVPKKVVH